MDQTDIQEMISKLDSRVTKDDAKLLIFVEDEEEGACEIIGNRKGYLRAAIELLRASVAPLEESDATITPIDVEYLGAERSLIVKRVIRSEDVEEALPPLKGPSWKAQMMAYGCLAILAFFCFCAFAGFGDLISWVFRK